MSSKRMTEMRKKAQAVTEIMMQFLSTYGWAFIIVVAAFGALVHFGGFELDTFLPEICTLTDDMLCLDYKANTRSVTLLVKNNAEFDMDSVRIGLQGDINVAACSPVDVSIPVGDKMIFVCSSESNFRSGKLKSEVDIAYTNRDTGLPHKKWGELILRVKHYAS